jgi:hypothetical protein
VNVGKFSIDFTQELFKYCILHGKLTNLSR